MYTFSVDLKQGICRSLEANRSDDTWHWRPTCSCLCKMLFVAGKSSRGKWGGGGVTDDNQVYRILLLVTFVFVHRHIMLTVSLFLFFLHLFSLMIIKHVKYYFLITLFINMSC